MQISVVIPTYNPQPDYLQRVITGLRAQTLGLTEWELIVVDNASVTPVATLVDLAWHPRGRVIREERLGLTAARLAGFATTSGEIIVLVDDDNVLAPDYLTMVGQIAGAHPFIGSWSGNVELMFEPGVTPPPTRWRSYLTERQCTRAVWSNDLSHHDSTPWGAGMCVRRAVADSYIRRSANDPSLLSLDLQGANLVYGGDTDIAYHGCSLGLGKGVFPQLHVDHLIPPQRCKRDYLLRVIEGRAYSEGMHQWVLHRTLPRKITNPIGRLKDLLRLALSDSAARAEERARRRGQARIIREIGTRQ